VGRVGGVPVGGPAQVPLSHLCQRAKMECVDQWLLAIVPSNTHLGARNRAGRVKTFSRWRAPTLVRHASVPVEPVPAMVRARHGTGAEARTGGVPTRQMERPLREYGVPRSPGVVPNPISQIQGLGAGKRASSPLGGPPQLCRPVPKLPNQQCASGQSVPGRDGCSPHVATRVGQGSYLVDPASSHMLVSKIKPCMSKYKQNIQ
jgi:hypothetical protein